LRPDLGLGRFGPGRPDLVSGRASIKLKNLNYSSLSVFGVIETEFWRDCGEIEFLLLLLIFDTFDHLSGYFRPIFREISREAGPD
jgi:hypothetical protein